MRQRNADDMGMPSPLVYIRKGGYFYRPDWCGYTSSAREAGLYDRTEAEAHAATSEGVTVHAMSEFPYLPPA